MIEVKKNIPKQVLIFYILTCAFSWLLWLPKILIPQGLLSLPQNIQDFLLGPFNPAAFGPTFAGLFLTYLYEGKAGIKQIIKRATSINLQHKWVLLIFILIPTIVGGSLYLASVIENKPLDIPLLTQPITLIIAFLYIFFLGGPLQEELGWRGFALEKLQQKYNSLTSSIIVGLLWGFWHLPLFLMPDKSFYYTRPIWGMAISTVLLSILFTLLYNNTKKSILAVLLLHTIFNWSHYVFNVLQSDLASLLHIEAFAVVAVIVVLIWGSQFLQAPKK